MLKSKCDSKGRLYLRESVRDRYGEQFVVVQAPDRLILLPVPSDAVSDLRQLGKPLRGLSLKQIKRQIANQAEKEAA